MHVFMQISRMNYLIFDNTHAHHLIFFIMTILLFNLTLIMIVLFMMKNWSDLLWILDNWKPS